MADALYGVLTLLAVCTLAVVPLAVVLPSSPPMFDDAIPPIPSTPESDPCPMPSSAQQPPSPGDLAFFRGDPHNRIDALIMRRTQSPWVHVGVIIDHGLMLSARSDGVRIEPLPTSAGAMIASTGAHLGERDAALRWLLQQAGNAYGFGDILNQALTWLNAQLPGWIDLPTLSFARHKDCSHLALDFLRIGGYPFSAAAHIAVLQPERVTPGTLASILPLDSIGVAA